jgi:hypothetical protein
MQLAQLGIAAGLSGLGFGEAFGTPASSGKGGVALK